MSKRNLSSQNVRHARNNRDNVIILSQDQPSSSSQSNILSQCMRSSTNSKMQSHDTPLQSMEKQEEMQLVSTVIRYLFAADRNKHLIQKNQIIKNALDGNSKAYRTIMENAKKQLSLVFGYKLVEVESNKYILVNEIQNHLPHLYFKKTASSQVLLLLVLVHIFMLGDSCKEEILWDFFHHLGITTHDNFQHEYFGDIKQLVTIDFVNQRYLEKIIPNKSDPTKCEYKWGCRALNEISYRSALEFVSNIYGQSSLNTWKLQYKAMLEQEHERKE